MTTGTTVALSFMSNHLLKSLLPRCRPMLHAPTDNVKEKLQVDLRVQCVCDFRRMSGIGLVFGCFRSFLRKVSTLMMVSSFFWCFLDDLGLRPWRIIVTAHGLIPT